MSRRQIVLRPFHGSERFHLAWWDPDGNAAITFCGLTVYEYELVQSANEWRNHPEWQCMKCRGIVRSDLLDKALSEMPQ